MFSRILTTSYTGTYSDNILRLKNEINTADAIVIGAGAGLSTSAGLTYDGERFDKYFSDFKSKYKVTDMYTGGFFNFDTLAEYWAWWSRHIYINRYCLPEKNTYSKLLEILKGKDYFVLTTNVDHQFQLAGFDKKRLFYTQGDYGLWQCSKACHDKTYDNKNQVLEMLERQKNMQVPDDLIPYCPVCGAPMTMNLRSDNLFVQDEGWYAAASRYEDFIRRHKNQHILFIELGVGLNTPVIIKYPFWQMTSQNSKAVYACLNLYDADAPIEIEKQAICINADITDTLNRLG